jgi:orotate phosphoribosyltransferase
MLASGLQQDYRLLEDVLTRKSIRLGNFTLASGKESHIYVDAKLTTCAASAIPLIGRVFITSIKRQGWEPAAVGGLTIGADPIALAIAGESVKAGREINAFVVRKESKKHGMQRHIEGIENTAGLPVVIIDDVCTTGESTATAIEKALSCGMLVLGAICLVDRQMGAQELIASRFGLSLASIFLLADLERYIHERDRTPEVVAAADI